jgi:hypothetical protein
MAKEYEILSGDKWSVVADTPDEAKAKYHAYQNDEDCSCGKEQWVGVYAKEVTDAGGDWREVFCDCVNELEADTWTDENELQLLDLEHKLRTQVAADEYRLQFAKDTLNEKLLVEVEARLELLTKVIGWL